MTLTQDTMPRDVTSLIPHGFRAWYQPVFTVLFLLGLGAALFYGVDAAALLRAFDHFSYGSLWWILAVAVVSLLVKSLRWHVLVARLVDGIPVRASVASYVGGQALVLLPGGFALRLWLLNRALGRSSQAGAAVLMQEFEELLSLMVLAAFALCAWEGNVAPLGAVLVVVACLAVVVTNDRLARACLRCAAPIRQLDGVVARLRHFRQQTRRLLNPKTMASSMALSLIGNLAGPVVLLLVWHGFGIQSSGISQASLVFSFSTLAGAVSPLPGGMGIAEIGLAGLMCGVLGSAVTANSAMAMGLVFRACTFLFSVALGLVTLVTLYAWSVVTLRSLQSRRVTTAA